MSRLPYVLFQNASTPDRYAILDLEADIAKEVTFLVTVSGSPSSFSVDLEGGHAVGPIQMYYPLATVTQPGYVTVGSRRRMRLLLLVVTPARPATTSTCTRRTPAVRQ